MADKSDTTVADTFERALLEIFKNSKADEGETVATTEPLPKPRPRKNRQPILLQHKQRKPVSYTIFDTEMKVVSSLNATALGFFSTAAFCLSIAVSVGLGWVYSDATSSFVNGVTVTLVVIPTIIAIGLYVVGFVAVKRRNGLIGQIKAESKDDVDVTRQAS